MKKMVVLFLCCAIAVVISILYFEESKKQSNENIEYVLSSNENLAFNGTFTNNSNSQFDVPDSSPGVPIDNYENLMELEIVEKVLPYYPLSIMTKEEDSDNIWLYWQSDKDKVNEISMPIATPYDSEMDLLTIKSVYDYNAFYSGLKKSTSKEAILHEFDSNSGIYISSFIYDQLNIDDQDRQLFIELTVQVPAIAQLQEMTMIGANPFNYVSYNVIEYTDVKVILEIQGVIDGTSGSFCGGNEIIIPYELAQEVYENADEEKVVVNENQTYWEPNSYIIVCKDGITIEELADALLSKLDTFYLNEYVYGDEYNYPYSYLYQGEDIYSYRQ